MYSRDVNGVLLLWGDPVDRIVVDEDLLILAFRWMRGGVLGLGVKSPWWAKFVEAESVERWLPGPLDIQIYEILLLECYLMLGTNDRKLLWTRCGNKKKISYRKCGNVMGVHHEVFRQQFQDVITLMQKLFDKRIKKRI